MTEETIFGTYSRLGLHHHFKAEFYYMFQEELWIQDREDELEDVMRANSKVLEMMLREQSSKKCTDCIHYGDQWGYCFDCCHDCWSSYKPRSKSDE